MGYCFYFKRKTNLSVTIITVVIRVKKKYYFPNTHVFQDEFVSLVINRDGRFQIGVLFF